MLGEIFVRYMVSDFLTEGSQIGETAPTDGTLFLTCWMTYAQIEKLRTEKVMFKDLQ